ncbi:MAG: hypothetical protein ACYC45_00345 [Acidithiobacillus ferriphilus]|uniref:hypothetical protein n=1 Tax=Acidithiobacillus ferriphilus TaxID=1689834 RepID=UPI001C063C5B|nr:hypothetical protein [Acidithiobacillus ferriphilus]MBU2785574.1 hypothetical protein [Acidithiobacillus ferriphilus]MBU2827226.1 hypothetical protein [Acidithiobacillus ferriphilus]MBU2845771.1 hypothetical protein [Acidithiobacillus ferriphilus]MEB8474338.1 hypothetical protein [Acidithiobacillus ferriphilus]UEP58312.1 hypothetical protein K1Y48_08145 [Acidithiobacillus ferriphilus]
MSEREKALTPDLRGLLTLPNAAFIPGAFTAILGREPDVVGLVHYALCLQRGSSRALLLAEIRTSPEGRRHAPHAISVDLDTLVTRYQKVRYLPLGRLRWKFLPTFGIDRQEHAGFDWEHWATDYVTQLIKRDAPPIPDASIHPDLANRVEALQQRVSTLCDAVQQSDLQESPPQTPQVGPNPATVSWEARGYLHQLLKASRG